MNDRVIRASERGSARAAAGHLRSGGILVFPTETSYGIGCDPHNPQAVRAVFQMKRRDRKSMPFIAASSAQIRLVAVLPATCERRIKRNWPGPLTVVLRKRSSYRSAALSGRVTIAIRVTGHAWARRLAAAFGEPVIATSANRSGQRPAFSLAASRRSLSGRTTLPILWIDGGTLPVRPPSTIIAWRRRTIRILRNGAVDNL